MTDDIKEEAIVAIGLWRYRPFLEPGRYRAEDRAHRLLPGNQTSTEKQIEQIWSNLIVKNRSDEHQPDEEEGFQFLRDCGSEEVCVCGRHDDTGGHRGHGIYQHLRIISGVWERSPRKDYRQDRG
eukprot:7891233-Heterocapsa_arctica.AAC.1